MARYQADENLPYFCTITVLDWIPVFIDARYVAPLIESLSFSRVNKGMRVFAFVVMPNHVHLIAAADDLHAVIRDFKRFTSRQIHDRLVANAEDWWYSSAAWYAGRQDGPMKMDAFEL